MGEREQKTSADTVREFRAWLKTQADGAREADFVDLAEELEALGRQIPRDVLLVEEYEKAADLLGQWLARRAEAANTKAPDSDRARRVRWVASIVESREFRRTT